jgi:hypothetical protein
METIPFPPATIEALREAGVTFWVGTEVLTTLRELPKGRGWDEESMTLAGIPIDLAAAAPPWSLQITEGEDADRRAPVLVRIKDIRNGKQEPGPKRSGPAVHPPPTES